MKISQYLNGIDPYQILKDWIVEEVVEVKLLIDELMEDNFMEESIKADQRLWRIPPVTQEELDCVEEMKQLQYRFRNKLTSLLH